MVQWVIMETIYGTIMIDNNGEYDHMMVHMVSNGEIMVNNNPIWGVSMGMGVPNSWMVFVGR